MRFGTRMTNMSILATFARDSASVKIKGKKERWREEAGRSVKGKKSPLLILVFQ
jgi:hypothetical protein